MPTVTEDTTKTLTNHLSHLIRMPTVSSDQATNRAALDWIEDQLKGLPFHFHRYEHNGSPSMIVTTHNTKSPKLWLAAHTDVVAGTPDQFEPYVKNGRMYGRGSHDMKFAIASFVTLCQELGEDLKEYDLGLMFTSDEELGGGNGVGFLLDDIGYRGHVAVIPDANGSWVMEMGGKGFQWLSLEATGQSTHSSRVWEGVNAIDELNAFVAELRTHFKTEPCGDPNHLHPTLNFATISADGATNQVPQTAVATIDIRYSPDVSKDTVWEWINETEQKFPSVRVKKLISDDPYLVNPNKANQLFEDLVEKITHHGVTHKVNHGSSDARYFARHKITTINVTPEGGGFHVDDEWMDLTDLSAFHEVLLEFVAKWAKE